MRKLLDFNNEKKLSGVIGLPREFAWPCRMYRITLPKVNGIDEFNYNPFELCFLRLLVSGHYTPREIAVETCLPPDLVEIILLRLYDRELIDQNFNVQEKIREELHKISNDEESQPAEYGTYCIFRECISGKLLPGIEDASVRSEDVEGSGKLVKNGKTIRLAYLQSEIEKTENPSVSDILGIFRTMARRQRETGEKRIMPLAKYISISPDSESCRLRVQLVMQLNGDWRIRDPFGRGWSRELESAYQGLLDTNDEERKSFIEWQKNNKKEKTEKGKPDDERIVEPFDTLENRARYPELIATLIRDYGADVYSAIEWALYYALQQRDLKPLINLLLFDAQEKSQVQLDRSVENLIARAIRQTEFQKRQGQGQDILENIVYKSLPNLGAESFTAENVDEDSQTEQNIKMLTEVKKQIHIPLPGKIKSFQEENMAEMQVVLPLAILVTEAEDFPLSKVMSRYPDFLSRIVELKKRRDEKRHGNSRWSEIFGLEDKAFMHDVVSLLLPKVQFTDRLMQDQLSSEDKFDERLNARLVLQDIFGVVTFDKMDSLLQENLLHLEMFRRRKHSMQDGKMDALRGINAMYAVLQCFFRPKLKGEYPHSTEISAVEKIVKDADWKNGLPESLRNVRTEMIQKTLAGNDQTLGASIISWLLLSEKDFLSDISTRLPKLFTVMDNVLKLSKHANQTCLMRESDFNELCNDVYETIKKIEE